MLALLFCRHRRRANKNADQPLKEPLLDGAGQGGGADGGNGAELVETGSSNQGTGICTTTSGLTSSTQFTSPPQALQNASDGVQVAAATEPELQAEAEYDGVTGESSSESCSWLSPLIARCCLQVRQST